MPAFAQLCHEPLFLTLSLVIVFKMARTAYLKEEIITEDLEVIHQFEVIPEQVYENGLDDDVDMHEIGKRDYSLEGYIMACNHTLDIHPDKVIRLISPYNGRKQYPGGLACEWEVMGNEDCKPVVACSVLDLRPTQHSDCSADDAVVISDGYSAVKSFCGPNLSFQHPFKARLGTYLYIQFRTGDSTHFDRLYKGLNCQIRCHKSPKAINQEFLPEGDPLKEEYTVLCGQKFNEGNERIVGGETVQQREFPWQAALVKTGSRRPFCGGSLINNRFILCAAHCVLEDLEDVNSVFDASSIEILLRAHVLEINERFDDDAVDVIPGQEVPDAPEKREEIRLRVDSITVHFLYNRFIHHENDISLLRLQYPLDLKDKNTPTPICLPVLSSPVADYEGKTATVTGWGYGHENARGTAKVLQKLDLPILAWSTCKKLYAPEVISENMLCAGYVEGGKDACQGDSGGPLILKDGNDFIQVGIVSFGEGCARKNRPGVFTHVTRLLPWIRHKTKGSTWPRFHHLKN